MPSTAVLQVVNGGAASVAIPLRPPREESDEGLATRSLGGEEAAFTELYRRYSTKLLNYVYRMIGDQEQAEDLVQETFVRVFRSLDRFDPRRRFSSWIYTIAGNLAKNELRRRARRPEVAATVLAGDAGADPVDSLEDETCGPDELCRRRALKETVHKAIAQMQPHYRGVLVLRELHDKTYEEIAEVEGIPLGTVKSRLKRAREQFATIVAPMLD